MNDLVLEYQQYQVATGDEDGKAVKKPLTSISSTAILHTWAATEESLSYIYIEILLKSISNSVSLIS